MRATKYIKLIFTWKPMLLGSKCLTWVRREAITSAWNLSLHIDPDSSENAHTSIQDNSISIHLFISPFIYIYVYTYLYIYIYVNIYLYIYIYGWRNQLSNTSLPVGAVHQLYDTIMFWLKWTPIFHMAVCIQCLGASVKAPFGTGSTKLKNKTIIK